ncbi:MAG: hypothetical protein QOD64_2053, partial [Verrucomicrobiota bacterium]
LVMLFPTIFHLETWRGFTEPGGGQFHPYWKPVLLAEMFGSLALLIISALLLVLFFRKRAVWPRTYAVFLLLILVASVLDFWFTEKIPAASSHGGNIRPFAQALGAAVIWVPYCFVSKRVKATFRR